MTDYAIIKPTEHHLVEARRDQLMTTSRLILWPVMLLTGMALSLLLTGVMIVVVHVGRLVDLDNGNFTAFVVMTDNLDEIYVADLNRHLTASLTHNDDHDFAPALSPDGRKVAFFSERDGTHPALYLMNLDGSDLQNIADMNYFDGNGIVWSPDGAHLAFVNVEQLDRDIFVADVEGGTVINLTGDSSANEYNPVWSPDGTQLAFASFRDSNDDIYIINRDGTNLRNVSHHPASDIHPVWSPDGSQIAFMSNRNTAGEIYVTHVDGGRTERVTYTEFLSVYSFFYNALSWAGNGEQLVYFGYDPTLPNILQLHSITPGAGQPHVLIDNLAPSSSGFGASLTRHSDTEILIALHGMSPVPDMYVFNLESGELHHVQAGD